MVAEGGIGSEGYGELRVCFLASESFSYRLYRIDERCRAKFCAH